MPANIPTLAIVGQPHSGKSSLFNVLADIDAPSSGTTVQIQTTDINIRGEKFHIVDLPGIYSLNSEHPVEKITVDYLLHKDIALVIHVVDSTMLARSLELTVELMELGLPMLLALNMQDETERLGRKIDAGKLEELLCIPVIPTAAVFGKGVKKLLDKAQNILKGGKKEPVTLPYTHHLELRIGELLAAITPHQESLQGSPRFYAIKAIENPEFLPEAVLAHTSELRKQVETEIHQYHKMDGLETIAYERHHLAMTMAEQSTTFRNRKKVPLTDVLDRYLLDPVLGYFFLLIFFTLYFITIFWVGALLSALVEKPMENLAGLFAHWRVSCNFLWHSVNGAYQGFFGAMGVVLPFFLPLVLLTSLFEDSGYMNRIAFLIDGLMHKIGLHGKSVIPFILGFGCSAPAIYATRILENHRDRIVTAMLIPFIPCSARITVIFSLTAALAGPLWAMCIFFFLILVIALNGKILCHFLPKPLGLILEIPPLRLPSLHVSLRRTRVRIKDFMKDTLVFLVVGGMVLGWIEFFHIEYYLNLLFAPIIKLILGLPEQLGATLLFGFFRKELILVMAAQALGVASISQLPLTVSQVVVFTVFVALYFPCLTSFIVICKEFGGKIALASAALSLVVATASAFCFKLALSWL